MQSFRGAAACSMQMVSAEAAPATMHKLNNQAIGRIEPWMAGMWNSLTHACRPI